MAISIIDLSNLDGNDGFRLDGATELDFSGRSVSNAGDVNGDGFDDVIIGASGADPNGFYSGSSYVVFGKAAGFNPSMNLSSLDGTNGFRLDGEMSDDWSGSSISTAGDVNGDGFDDVIIGASGADPNGNGSGSSYVVFGKAAGYSPSMNLSSLDGTNGFRLDGEMSDDWSGSSISTAGDVNGDGFDDVIVGTRVVDAIIDYNRSDFSYVVFGKAAGFNPSMNLSSLDGTDGFRLDGEAPNDWSGFSVSTAGDVNGDGFDDVIVGTSATDTNGYGAGSSYVVFGKAAGFNPSMNLSSLDGNNGFRLDGAAELDFSGRSVSNAGDVNGDGFDDVIIGAVAADPNGFSSGSSYVVFGKAAGFNPSMNLSSLDGNNGFRLDGEAGLDLSGYSVSTAGDVNGDGFDDLIVGAWGADSNGDRSGSSYVVFGKAAGYSRSMNLSSLDGTNGFRLDGETSRDYSGMSVSAAGDVNGDGFDDLIVGASEAGSNGEMSGSSYIILGHSDFGNGGLPEILGTSADDQLKGTSAAEHFKAGHGDDRLLGLGGADEFHGEAGNDYIQVLDLGFALVNGGGGSDVLHLDGKDLNLDLTDYLDKIHNIETICLYGRGDNTLTLTGAELQDLSDATNTLKVHGNAGDRVVLEGNWVDEGSHGFYHTYTQDDAVLLVGMNMAADLA